MLILQTTALAAGGMCSVNAQAPANQIRVKLEANTPRDDRKFLRAFEIFEKNNLERGFQIDVDGWVNLDPQLRPDDTLRWRFSAKKLKEPRKYAIYPAWWQRSKATPCLVSMEPLFKGTTRLRNMIEDRAKNDFSGKKYWEALDDFNQYYCILKEFYGVEVLPPEVVMRLRNVEEGVYQHAIDVLISNDAQNDQERVQYLHILADWFFDAYLKDVRNAGGLKDDLLLRRWHIDVLHNRLYAATRLYASRWQNGFPDKRFQDLDLHGTEKDLLYNDVHYVCDRIYGAGPNYGWDKMIRKSVESIQNAEKKKLCLSLLYDTDGFPDDIRPVFAADDTGIVSRDHQNARLSALYRAISILKDEVK